MANEHTIWTYLFSQGLHEPAVFGLMGNLRAESGLNPINMENSYERKLGFNDQTYTAAVDSGAYNNFVVDRCGYGLAQWTGEGRKCGLLNYAHRTGRSIGNIYMQLEYLMQELNGSYRHVLDGIQAAKTIREASDIVLTKFEIPANQSEAVKQQRAALGEDIYRQYQIASGKTGNDNPYEMPTKNLRYNSKGNGVRWLQVELNRRGYHLIVDGIWGDKTEEAFRAFQADAGIAVDGICGPVSRQKLLEG